MLSKLIFYILNAVWIYFKFYVVLKFTPGVSIVFYKYHTLGDELVQGEKIIPVLIEFTFCDLWKCSLLKENCDFALLQLFSFKVSEFLNGPVSLETTPVCNQTLQFDHNHTRKVSP